MYFELIEKTSRDKKELLDSLYKFYLYVKADRELPKNEYKIKIKSRNMKEER